MHPVIPILPGRRGPTVAAVHLEQRPGGREAVLFGVTHIATPEFYSQLQHKLDGLDHAGWAVQYEMVKSDTAPLPWTLSEEEVADIRVVTLWRDIFPGLIHQHQGLRIRPHWVNTDLTAAEMRALVSERTWERLSNAEESLTRLAALLRERPTWRRRLPHAFVAVCTAFSVAALIPALRNKPRVVIGVRNMIAVRAIDTAEGDVAAVWGAAHLPGISAGLRARGWGVTRVERHALWGA
jgi:hypothetical protein